MKVSKRVFYAFILVITMLFTIGAVSASNVLISEVYYDTIGTDSVEEFVELYNPTLADVDLSGWALSDNVGSYSIPAGTVIRSTGYITIAKAASGFNALFGFDPDVSGMTLGLGNSGDQVSLKDVSGSEVDFVAWEGFVSDWSIVAATGISIQRISPDVDTDTVSDWSTGEPNPTIASTPTTTEPPSTTPPPTTSTDKIRIASFNIQIFGQTKIGKADVMDILSNIARNFDLIAIQEIRDISETTMPTYKSMINAMEGPDYDFIIGPRLGRSTSKEQYAYLYNTETIGAVGSGVTYPDDSDVFEREPFIAAFEALGGNFDFVLIVNHVKPDDAENEINNMPDVVSYAQQIYAGEGDFIVLGDLNADCSYFDEDGPTPLRSTEYTWLIENTADTTTKTTDCTYDRIIITGGALGDYTGDSGVYGFDTVYGLTYDETTAVSDHYPVYAEFSTNQDTDGEMTSGTPTPTTTPAPTTAAAPTTTPPPETTEAPTTTMPPETIESPATTEAPPTTEEDSTAEAAVLTVVAIGAGYGVYKRRKKEKK